MDEWKRIKQNIGETVFILQKSKLRIKDILSIMPWLSSQVIQETDMKKILSFDYDEINQRFYQINTLHSVLKNEDKKADRKSMREELKELHIQQSQEILQIKNIFPESQIDYWTGPTYIVMYQCEIMRFLKTMILLIDQALEEAIIIDRAAEIKIRFVGL